MSTDDDDDGSSPAPVDDAIRVIFIVILLVIMAFIVAQLRVHCKLHRITSLLPCTQWSCWRRWWYARYERERRRRSGVMNGGNGNTSEPTTPYTPTTPQHHHPTNSVMAGYLLKGQLQILCLIATCILTVMSPDPIGAYDILHPVAYSFVVRNVSTSLLIAWTLWLQGILSTRYRDAGRALPQRYHGIGTVVFVILALASMVFPLLVIITGWQLWTAILAVLSAVIYITILIITCMTTYGLHKILMTIHNNQRDRQTRRRTGTGPPQNHQHQHQPQQPTTAANPQPIVVAPRSPLQPTTTTRPTTLAFQRTHRHSNPGNNNASAWATTRQQLIANGAVVAAARIAAAANGTATTTPATAAATVTTPPLPINMIRGATPPMLTPHHPLPPPIVTYASASPRIAPIGTPFTPPGVLMHHPPVPPIIPMSPPQTGRIIAIPGPGSPIPQQPMSQRGSGSNTIMTTTNMNTTHNNSGVTMNGTTTTVAAVATVATNGTHQTTTLNAAAATAATTPAPPDATPTTASHTPLTVISGVQGAQHRYEVQRARGSGAYGVGHGRTSSHDRITNRRGMNTRAAQNAARGRSFRSHNLLIIRAAIHRLWLTWGVGVVILIGVIAMDLINLESRFTDPWSPLPHSRSKTQPLLGYTLIFAALSLAQYYCWIPLHGTCDGWCGGSSRVTQVTSPTIPTPVGGATNGAANAVARRRSGGLAQSNRYHTPAAAVGNDPVGYPYNISPPQGSHPNTGVTTTGTGAGSHGLRRKSTSPRHLVTATTHRNHARHHNATNAGSGGQLPVSPRTPISPAVPVPNIAGAHPSLVTHPSGGGKHSNDNLPSDRSQGYPQLSLLTRAVNAPPQSLVSQQDQVMMVDPVDTNDEYQLPDAAIAAVKEVPFSPVGSTASLVSPLGSPVEFTNMYARDTMIGSPSPHTIATTTLAMNGHHSSHGGHGGVQLMTVAASSRYQIGSVTSADSSIPSPLPSPV